MIKNNEFAELVLYYDSREQSNVDGRPRVHRIINWYESHGGTMYEERALPLCDYVLCGGFDSDSKKFLPGILRGKEICVGIEYKQMVDYSNSHPDLEWKLIDAYLYFKQVALFVEEGDMELSYSNGTFVRNKSVPNGTADILPYEHYKNELDRYSRIAEIHVRTFPYETFIDANLDSLMVMVSEEPKVPMYCRGKDLDQEKVAFINSLLYIPKIGVSTAMKFTNYYPNWEVMADHASIAGEYEAIAGILTGKRVRDFVQMGSEKNKKICSRKNECFDNRKTLKIAIPDSHEEKYIPMDKEQKSIVADAIYNYLNSFYPEGKTPLEICEHFDCQDDHIKDMLICIKRMAENGRITSTIKGIFVAVPKTSSYTPGTILNNTQTNPTPILGGNTTGIIPVVQITSPMTSGIVPNEDVSKSQNISESAKTDKINSLDIHDTPSIEQKAMQSSNLDTSVVLSQSIEQLSNVSINSQAKENMDNSSLDTRDILQSPQHNTIPPPILCGDKAGSDIILPATFIPKLVIHSLDDVIVDFCYENPKADFSIISYCQSKGYELPEIHKALSGLSKTKLHRYKEGGMEKYSYKGLKATPEMDIGV